MIRSLTSKSLTARTPCFISAGAEATGETVTAQEEEEANPWGLQDGSVAGLRLDAFPDAETWQDMITFFRQHQPLRQEVGVHTDGLLSLPILLMVIVIVAIFKENIFRPPMTQSETLHFLFFLFPNGKYEPSCPEEALGKETPRGHKRPLATWLQTHAANCLVRRWQPSSSCAAATTVTAEKTAVLWKAVNIGYKSSHENPARKTPAVPFAASSHDTWTSAISSVGRLLARALSSVDSLRVPWQFTNCTTSPSRQTYPPVRGWPENRP